MGGKGSGRRAKGGGRYPNRRKLVERKNRKKPGLEKKKKKKYKKPRQHSSEIKQLERRNKVSKLMIERPMTQREMGTVLGVSASVINRDIKWLKEQYVKEALDNVEIAKAQVIRRMEYVLREAHDAWEKSKAEEVEIKTKQKTIRSTAGKTKPTENESSEKRKNTPGDPRFLEQFRDAAIEIASYEGVNKLQGSQDLNVNINLPDLPAEYSDFGLTPNLPEEQRKKLPLPGQEVSEVPEEEDNIEDAEIIEENDG